MENLKKIRLSIITLFVISLTNCSSDFEEKKNDRKESFSGKISNVGGLKMVDGILEFSSKDEIQYLAKKYQSGTDEQTKFN